MFSVPSRFFSLHVLFAFGAALLIAPLAAAQPGARKAWVIDERLSVLRREPHLQGQVIQRLRAGRLVYILTTRRGEPAFYRVAVTRRTRGWIHAGSVAAPHRAGDDERLLARIADSDDVERLRLCDIYLKHFSRPRGAARVLLLIGEAGDRAAEALTRRLARRMARLREPPPGISRRDFFLSDAALDRYSKLGVRFDFNETTGRLVYDGRAYREVLRRYPRSPEAKRAAEALAAVEHEMARR